MRNFNKKRVLELGIYHIMTSYNRFAYYYYEKNDGLSLDDIPYEILPYKDFIYFVKKYPRIYSLCCKIATSKRGKVYRVKNRISDMLFDSNGCLKDCLFLTLTFKDNVLSKTSQETRRTYVRRFLKSQSDDFVANIDFGDLNGREHYHSIFGSARIDSKLWPYGTVNFLKITKTPDKIAQYINKLTYHSTKDTTGFLIYSRKNKKF